MAQKASESRVCLRTKCVPHTHKLTNVAQAEAAEEGKARARERKRKPKKKKRGAEYWLEDAQAGQPEAQYGYPPNTL